MRSAHFMRDNLKELNRSMESIEKMIEKSRRIISRSKESHNSLEKMKENPNGYYTKSFARHQDTDQT
jgi:hypothetical protein